MSQKVSIIIPVFNCENIIQRCLDSILRQTYPEIEIIIINDGSTDKSGDICMSYKKRDSRIIFLSIDNHGVSYSRNLGIENSSGDFILFVDSDDYVLPDYVYNMVNNANNCQYVVSNIQMVNPYKILPRNKTSIFRIPLKEGNYEIKDYLEVLAILGISPLIGAPYCKLYMRDIVINNHVRFNENTCYAEDLEFNLSYLRFVKNVAISTNADYIYWKIIGNTLSRKKYDFKYLEDRWETLFSFYDKLFQTDSRENKNRELIHRLGFDILFSAIAQNDWSHSRILLNEINSKIRCEKNIKIYTFHDLVKRKTMINIRLIGLEVYRPLQRLVYFLRSMYNPSYLNY